MIPQAICGVVHGFGQKRKRHRIVVGLLHLQARPIDRFAVEARWGARLQAAELQPEAVETIGQLEGGRFASPAGRDFLLAHMDEAVEEGAGRQNDGARAKRRGRRL